MAKRPNLPCCKCGRLMWRKAGASLPDGKAKCQPCRRQDGPPNPHPGRTVPLDEHVRRMVSARQKVVDLACETCSQIISGPRGLRFCGQCRLARRRDHYRRKNAQRMQAMIVGPALPMHVLGERDEWRCHLCGLSVDRLLSGMHPGMASYDHVIPVSRGGTDLPANLRLAHLRCNVRRGNRPLARQVSGE